ncbi:MAG: hypothetical protein EPN22_00330 [Nitrospirae bacterium]|nr:MAG: hypothetical protein EPN22_00330 [Nitrospirota bacterium]
MKVDTINVNMISQPSVKSDKFKTALICKGNRIELNSFTQKYIGNVVMAIAGSFGNISNLVTVHIDENFTGIYSDGKKIVIEKEFARQLLQSTVKGLLSPLNGVFWEQEITITVSMNDDSMGAA